MTDTVTQGEHIKGEGKNLKSWNKELERINNLGK